MLRTAKGQVGLVSGAALLAMTLSLTVAFTMAGPAFAIEKRPGRMWDDLSDLKVEAFQMADGLGGEPIYDCFLSSFYYIPCPTYSWFWAYSGWKPGDIVGASFTIGDQPTGGGWPCDPQICRYLDGIEVLDFAGFGTVYPGQFTFEMDVFYCDTTGVCGCHLWNSGPLETHFGWNYFEVDPPVFLWDCPEFCLPWEEGCPYPTFVVTMQMTGTDGNYPSLAFDNVSVPAEQGCPMHDAGCLPVLYPRNGGEGDEPRVRSGYVGTFWFEHWPPRPIPDGKHAGEPGGFRWYGYAEPAWRVHLICAGPTASPKQDEPATWGTIKSLYK